jgi:hypothetical protein
VVVSLVHSVTLDQVLADDRLALVRLVVEPFRADQQEGGVSRVGNSTRWD